MAQFDVYTNPSKTSKNTYPYILDIQNNLIDELASRIVVPLALYNKFKNKQLKGLTPMVTFEGEKLLILMPLIASMPAKSLKNPIGTLSHLRDEIIATLDFAITGI